MENINSLFIKEDNTIKESLEIIDKAAMRIAIVIDSHNKFLGTLSDGDIRRALLSSLCLSDSIKDIYFKNCTTGLNTESKEEIIKKAIQNKVYQIPILDTNNYIVDVLDLATLLSIKKRKNKVILMAGGLGTRLRPLTTDTPKPLLKVGNKPILQTIIESFASHGFENIIISLNYKSQMIRDYFKDGKDYGVTISYIEENKRLGTAGALSLLHENPSEPFFVMNADLLTNVNFAELLDFHTTSHSIGTMCVREYQYQIPYGVIETKDTQITSIIEKPTQKFFVNAGIYLLNPEVLNYVPKNEYYDMPTLFENIIEQQKKVLSSASDEYWLDIGQHHDFVKANEEYMDIFN